MDEKNALAALWIAPVRYGSMTIVAYARERVVARADARRPRQERRSHEWSGTAEVIRRRYRRHRSTARGEERAQQGSFLVGAGRAGCMMRHLAHIGQRQVFLRSSFGGARFHPACRTSAAFSPSACVAGSSCGIEQLQPAEDRRHRRPQLGGNGREEEILFASFASCSSRSTRPRSSRPDFPAATKA